MNAVKEYWQDAKVYVTDECCNSGSLAGTKARSSDEFLVIFVEPIEVTDVMPLRKAALYIKNPEIGEVIISANEVALKVQE